MAAGQQGAIIAIAPKDDTRGGTAAGTTAGSHVFQVTTAAGRTLLIVVAPDAGAGTTTGGTTTGGATAGAGSTAGGGSVGNGKP